MVRLFVLVALLLSCALRLAHGAPAVRICDDIGGWPPYSFTDPKNPQRVTGAAVEVVSEILRRAGYEPTIALLPWKRCLSEVEDGTSAALLHATHNEERARLFLISEPYYSMNSSFYYLTSRFPVPPKISTAADLANYRFCGLAGYNYEMYSIPAARIDSGARTEAARFEKLRLDRCDFVIGDDEILRNFASMGQVDLKGTATVPIPGAVPKNFHVMISRTDAGGERLLKVINEGIAALKADKSYARIFKKFGL